MVNEEVLKLVDTEPLHGELLVVGPFDDALLGGNAEFDMETLRGHTHAATGGSFVTPVDTTESFDLFKLQDDEPMDTLDPSKEPPVDWEPGPEDEVDAEEIAEVTYLLQGRVAPLYEPVEFGLGERSIEKAVAQAFGVAQADVHLKDAAARVVGLVFAVFFVTAGHSGFHVK